MARPIRMIGGPLHRCSLYVADQVREIRAVGDDRKLVTYIVDADRCIAKLEAHGRMPNHLSQRRAPQKLGGFSWGRFPTGSNAIVPGASWRLFRRDHTGRTHALFHLFPVEVERQQIARELRGMRRELRDRVDEIDLQQWDAAA